MYNAENYTISVRKEDFDGEQLYVARVLELPDVEEYADTVDEARELAIDTINASRELCLEQGIAFPEPHNFSELDNVSGRITLRLPKSLHASLIKEAEVEGVSLNQHLVASLAVRYGQSSMSHSLQEKIENYFSRFYKRLCANHEETTQLFKQEKQTAIFVNFKEQQSPNRFKTVFSN